MLTGLVIAGIGTLALHALAAVRYRKVGGLHMVQVGRLTLQACVSKRSGPQRRTRAKRYSEARLWKAYHRGMARGRMQAAWIAAGMRGTLGAHRP